MSSVDGSAVGPALDGGVAARDRSGRHQGSIEGRPGSGLRSRAGRTKANQARRWACHRRSQHRLAPGRYRAEFERLTSRIVSGCPRLERRLRPQALRCFLWHSQRPLTDLMPDLPSKSRPALGLQAVLNSRTLRKTCAREQTCTRSSHPRRTRVWGPPSRP